MKEILDTISDQLMTMANIIPSLLTALAVFVIGLILAKTLRKIIGRLLARALSTTSSCLFSSWLRWMC